jgi:hypothetical protein
MKNVDGVFSLPSSFTRPSYVTAIFSGWKAEQTRWRYGREIENAKMKMVLRISQIYLL